MCRPDTFERAIAAGGVVVFPADTVYGLACDPGSAVAVERLYALKGRPPEKPAAVMFFALEPALAALPELGARTRAALEGLLPGGVTLLLPNPRRRFPLACGPDPATLGLRVADVPALRGVRVPVLQSSANRVRRRGRAAARRRAAGDPRRRGPRARRRRAARHAVDRGGPAPLRGDRRVERGAGRVGRARGDC